MRRNGLGRRELCICLCLSVIAADLATAGDWNQFRGPNRDNLCHETGLLNQWPESGPELEQTISGLGEGYSSVAIVGDTIYTMGNLDGGEYVIAVDRNSGDLLWKTRNGNEYKEGQGNGPRGTPTVINGKVYSLGGNGDVSCLDASTGKSVWQKNILKDYGGQHHLGNQRICAG